ncbi:MAG TPA: bifunctional 5,6,7,8-tetrahydromethanopterin hydro-lyase/3-hexulose-6-phosphate synthase [Nitrososphaerales archaeon]|nr:bifunctional 5,6,7,8-tetrahydromethanopterin hydro-lyase/3-hexulose-6-phosphate synthase [Nitrososphaerales archaeon]
MVVLFFIGEALIGEGNEVAHIDLMIGDKEGPVGQAFANGLTQLSVGHTPLLAVIRPNLPPKPFTLIIPKVTVKDMDQVSKIFGPAQASVAKAIADAVEEGAIPNDQIEKLVIVCSVFIHPQAEDFRKIYHYNYSATKLALKRALTNYPPLEKIAYDKDRAKHPIMGFRVPRLWMPPYVQIALDMPDIDALKKVVYQLPKSDRILFEVGTPLVKRYGMEVIREIRKFAKDAFVIADLKTLDVGQVEVDLAFNETADAVVVSGLASSSTINKFIYESKRLGIYSSVDMMEVNDPLGVLKGLDDTPDIVILHRGIDEESKGKTRWQVIQDIKNELPGKKILFSVAGGIREETAKEALKKGADILIVGRYITQSKDVEKAARGLLNLVGEDMDLYRIHVE